jgi:hypothetical protein
MAAAASEPAPPSFKNGPPPKNDAVYVPYWGVVTELTKNSITIRGPGEEPKAFPVSETLAAGRVPAEPRLFIDRDGRRRDYGVAESSMYRLTDVKVGDWIGIKYAYLDGVSICDHICIWKRPGGLVPPLPAEAEARRNPLAAWKASHPGQPVPKAIETMIFIPYHEEMNAKWDLEDKGIPYPEKFGRYRRFPTAPMPRAVPIPKLRDGELP